MSFVHESFPSSRYTDDFQNDGSSIKLFIFAVIAPIACVLLNIPSVCGPRAFDLDSRIEVLGPFFLAGGLIGSLTMAWSLSSQRISWRRIGWIIGMLFTASFASGFALIMLLGNVIAMILFPSALIIGVLPYISVALWIWRGFVLLFEVQDKCERPVTRHIWGGVVLSIAVILITQTLVLNLVTQSTRTLIEGDFTRAPLATQMLEVAVWCDDTCSEPLQEAFYRTSEPARQQVLREAYLQLTGRDIDAPSYPSGCY
jgi:hypothetical protein